jgi:hypothetical protein
MSTRLCFIVDTQTTTNERVSLKVGFMPSVVRVATTMNAFLDASQGNIELPSTVITHVVKIQSPSTCVAYFHDEWYTRAATHNLMIS